MIEAVNATVLDSACSKTVDVHGWKEMDLVSLSANERKVKYLLRATIFKFGVGKKNCLIKNGYLSIFLR